MGRFLSRFVRDESGATAIEYGLIAALVCVASLAALSTMGGAVTVMFNDVAEKVATAMGGAGI